ncbi:MAG: hypothetical protein APF84_19655 [Gracilibacter sp. BRH_c7a]|nr:MAG: hypothetical protein APF84_19655 [Gracilibacter sp. BRH_c7a]
MIVTVTAGLFLMVIGALIWKFRLIRLFGGKRADKETDEAGLAKWIGFNLIIIGIVISIFAAVQMQIFHTTYMLVDFTIIIILSTRMAMGTAKFHKPKGSSKKKSNKVKK